MGHFTASCTSIFLGALLAVFSSVSAYSPSAPPGLAGLWWNKDMNLGDNLPSTIAGWRKAYTQPWKQNGEAVSFKLSKGAHARTVDNCRQLVRLSRLGFESNAADHPIVGGWLANCHAVEQLVQAGRPKQNFLGVSNLEEWFGMLPPDLGVILSADDRARAKRIRESGGTLADFAGKVEIKAIPNTDGKEITISYRGPERQFMMIDAIGDFDHDGMADFLVYSSNRLQGGTYAASHLYVVSRLKKGGPLVLRKQVM